MTNIAVFGGTGYLASLIRNQNKTQNNYFFFSRKKNVKNCHDLFSYKKKFGSFKNIDFIIHLAGPSQQQLKKDKGLIKKKNKITLDICNLCLQHDIKLIYISSLQVYKNYGIDSLSTKSKLNLKNLYSKSHYETEQVIFNKILKKKMFTILRIGNVFGFKKYENIREINNNLIHGFCFSALKTNKIIIKNGFIQRSFVPSKVFIEVINSIIKNNYFENKIVNISYKNFALQDIARLIQKRSKSILNLSINVLIKKLGKKNIYRIYSDKKYQPTTANKQINIEIDQILKNIKKIVKLQKII